jgi:hypothetical protein
VVGFLLRHSRGGGPVTVHPGYEFNDPSISGQRSVAHFISIALFLPFDEHLNRTSHCLGALTLFHGTGAPLVEGSYTDGGCRFIRHIY